MLPGGWHMVRRPATFLAADTNFLPVKEAWFLTVAGL